MAERIHIADTHLYHQKDDWDDNYTNDAVPCSSKREVDPSARLSVIYTNTNTDISMISEQYLTHKYWNVHEPELPSHKTENAIARIGNFRKVNTALNYEKLPPSRSRSPGNISDQVLYSPVPTLSTSPTSVPNPCAKSKRLTRRDICSNDIFGTLEYAIQKPYKKGMSQLTKHLKQESDGTHSPWFKMKDGKNLVTTAACSGNMEIMQVLVSYGADLSAQDDYYDTPLHHAAQHGYTDIIRLIFNSNVNINVRNGANNTPLHIACWFNKPATVLQLIEFNANLNAQNDKEETPHDIARKMNMTQIQMILDRENERRHGKDMKLEQMRLMHLSDMQQSKSSLHNVQINEVRENIENTIDARALKIEEQCKVHYENTIKIVNTCNTETKRQNKEVQDLKVNVDNRIQDLHRGNQSLSRDVTESNKLIKKVQTNVNEQCQELTKRQDDLEQKFQQYHKESQQSHKEAQQSHKESQQDIISAVNMVKSDFQQAVVQMNQIVSVGFQSMAYKPTNITESSYVGMESRCFHPQSTHNTFQPQSYHPYRYLRPPQPCVVPGTYGYPRHLYHSVPHASQQTNASAYDPYKYPENPYESLNLQSAPQYIPGHPQLIPTLKTEYLTDSQKSVLQQNYKSFTQQAKLKYLLSDLYSAEIIDTEKKNKLKSCDNMQSLAEEIHDLLMRGNQLQCQKLRDILIQNNQEAVAKLLPVLNL